MNYKEYSLLDSGSGEKLEQFGSYTLSRPCSQAVWQINKKRSEWKKADARFSREGKNNWDVHGRIPDKWGVELDGLRFVLSLTDFGHVGIFPEHSWVWKQAREIIRTSSCKARVLNLFAYSGGATLACAKEGAEVTHVDASKGMVDWARENARANELDKAPIRWITDDAIKFLKREVQRGRKYDGIILDPPSFGRGKRGEVFKIEEHLLPMLQLCRDLLSDTPLFFFLSCHTPGYTPYVLQNILSQLMRDFTGTINAGELTLPSLKKEILPLPTGTFASWRTSNER